MLPERDQQLSLQGTLSNAREMGGKYEWMQAAGLYDHAAELNTERGDFFATAEAREALAYCYERSAFQANSVDEFIGRMQLASLAYDDASELFERSESNEGKGRAAFSHTNAIYAKFWTSKSRDEKVKLLDQCRRLGNEILGQSDAVNNKTGLVHVCNRLAAILLDLKEFEADWKNRQQIIQEGLVVTTRAIQLSADLEDKSEVARAYALASFTCHFAPESYEGAEKQKQYIRDSLEYGRKAVEFAASVADSNVIALAHYALASALDLSNDPKAATEHYLKQLEHAKIARDNYLIGWAIESYGADIWALMTFEADPEKKKEGYQKAIQYTEEAARYLSLINYDIGVCCALAYYAEGCLSMARELEGNRNEALEVLKKAITVARQDLERAEQSGLPRFQSGVRNCLSKSLYYLSTMETNYDIKRSLLQEAMELREERVEIGTKAFPYRYWERTVDLSSLAMIEAGLSRLETGLEQRSALLESAMGHMDLCLENAERALRTVADPKGLLSGLGSYYDTYARIINELYTVTSKPVLQGKLLKVLDGAIIAYSRSGLSARVAEAYWREGATLHKLENHIEAEMSFAKASESYESAAKLIPGLKDLYEEYALYMKAWAAISRARSNHRKEEYDAAKTNYTAAANYLRGSKRWGYLSANYDAWARLEESEALSRADMSEEALTGFDGVARSFQESRLALERVVDSLEDPEERGEALQLITVSELRMEYCEGREAVEQGRVSDKSGDHISSSKSYSTAASIFENIAAAMTTEDESRELVPIIQLCRAWEKMALAEARASPELYAEACALFTSANETSTSEKTGLVSLGHSYVCRALESGTKYESSRDAKLHSAAKEYLETAGAYYAKAGFTKASEWAAGTQILFDAFLYCDNAQAESDPERKTKLYGLAEKCFTNAAELFDRAGYSGKKNEAIRMAEGIRRKREIAVSLMEALRAPTLLSTTTSFATPTASTEDAVGFEPFEHALMEASVSFSDSDVSVAQEVYLDVELVNAGRTSAILNEIEGLVPGGFAVKTPPERYAVEGTSINLRGRKLEPLKNEHIRMLLKAQIRGVIYLRPKLLYQDENGQQKSYDLKPLTIAVRELGLSGWLKGPSK